MSVRQFSPRLEITLTLKDCGLAPSPRSLDREYGNRRGIRYREAQAG